MTVLSFIFLASHAVWRGGRGPEKAPSLTPAQAGLWSGALELEGVNEQTGDEKQLSCNVMIHNRNLLMVRYVQSVSKADIQLSRFSNL